MSEPREVTVVALRGVPAQYLNYRFETDVQAPEQKTDTTQMEERNKTIQEDFDQNRPKEVLDRTITAPDKNHILAVYRKIGDVPSEFRLDMYSANGKPIRKITPEEMAIHFPGTIVWSPDSKNLVFIAMVREGQEPGFFAKEKPRATPLPVSTVNNSNSASGGAEAPMSGSPEPPKKVPAFRTEQIYICGSDGSNVKPLTQKEGLIYFYAVWAPDSSALVALASPFTEWRIRESQMAQAGERFLPTGRPRLIEKNGQERLLDDYLTAVHPIWSPDSSKVAVAFDKHVRLYDAIGEMPTQAGIPVEKALLLASKTYEENLKKEEKNVNLQESGNVNDANEKNEDLKANSNTNLNAPASTLSDADTPASFNPIIDFVWEQDTNLYLKTGYVKNYIDNEVANRQSFIRWHKLTLSPQDIRPPDITR